MLTLEIETKIKNMLFINGSKTTAQLLQALGCEESILTKALLHLVEKKEIEVEAPYSWTLYIPDSLKAIKKYTLRLLNPTTPIQLEALRKIIGCPRKDLEFVLQILKGETLASELTEGWVKII